MKILLLVIIISLGISLAIVQLQVHRLDFFFKYWVEQDIRNLGVKNNKVYEYFSSVNFAEINWDHIRAVGQWQKLPYFQYLCKELKPEEILLLEQKIQDSVYRSNLFWFPNINKFESKNSIPSPIKCDYQQFND